jgi:hypothetical protein
LQGGKADDEEAHSSTDWIIVMLLQTYILSHLLNKKPKAVPRVRNFNKIIMAKFTLFMIIMIQSKRNIFFLQNYIYFIFLLQKSKQVNTMLFVRVAWVLIIV